MNRTHIASSATKLFLTTLLGSGLLLSSAGPALAGWQHNRYDQERWEERQQRHDRHDCQLAVQARPVYREVVIRELPRQARRVRVGKALYDRDGDHFFSRRPGGFVLVSPPAGVVVAKLPGGFIRFSFGGSSYFHCDDVYYRPVAGGYLVVDPVATGLLCPSAATTVRVVLPDGRSDWVMSRFVNCDAAG